MNKTKKFTHLFSIGLCTVALISTTMLGTNSTAYAIFNPGGIGNSDLTTGNWSTDGGGGSSKESFEPGVVSYTYNELYAYANKVDDVITAYNCIDDPTNTSPSSSTDYNDLDNVIYMIKRLEDHASNFLTITTRQNINNAVLGYLRGINVNYTGLNGFISDIEWNTFCGEINYDFIGYTNTQEKAYTLPTAIFFSSYLNDRANFNSAYGTLSAIRNYELPDPLGSGQTIDLIHLFAAIDAIYEDTAEYERICNLAFGNNTIQKENTT